MFFIFLLLIQSYRCANVQDLLDPTNTSIIFGSSFTDDQVSTLYKQIKKCGESAAPRNMKVKLYCCVPGIPADLPQHQPDQDRHGAGPDGCPLQPGQPLREPLRRSQSGNFSLPNDLISCFLHTHNDVVFPPPPLLSFCAPTKEFLLHGRTTWPWAGCATWTWAWAPIASSAAFTPTSGSCSSPKTRWREWFPLINQYCGSKTLLVPYMFGWKLKKKFATFFQYFWSGIHAISSVLSDMVHGWIIRPGLGSPHCPHLLLMWANAEHILHWAIAVDASEGGQRC